MPRREAKKANLVVRRIVLIQSSQYIREKEKGCQMSRTLRERRRSTQAELTIA